MATKVQSTAVGVLLHVTIESRDLWQVMQRGSDC